MAQLLSDQEIEARLHDSSWHQEGAEIVRELQFADFAAAIAFVNYVAAAAEQLGHHPDILVHSWNKVRLTLCSHSAGGLTALDFELAGAIDRFG